MGLGMNIGIGNEKDVIAGLLSCSPIDEEKIRSILWFTLVWNLFEKECCNKKANINKHSDAYAKYPEKFDAQILSGTWGFFHDRYVSNEKVTDIFEIFEFRQGDKKEEVKRILLRGNDAIPSEKVETLLRIIFRLRNNLFHGEKDVEELYKQNETFAYANRFLLDIIEKHEA